MSLKRRLQQPLAGHSRQWRACRGRHAAWGPHMGDPGTLRMFLESVPLPSQLLADSNQESAQPPIHILLPAGHGTR